MKFKEMQTNKWSSFMRGCLWKCWKALEKRSNHREYNELQWKGKAY